jgi:pimeloyl-ACP methyl ester carboxylesterase
MHLSYYEAGPTSAETIVFLYGGGAATWFWQSQVEAFCGDYYYLVPDLPEHGCSAKVKPFTIQGRCIVGRGLIREKAHHGRVLPEELRVS